MSDIIETNQQPSNQEEGNYNETVEDDGLSVTVDEETDTITFTWNEETHPQWNVLKEYNKEELIKLMYKHFDVVLEDTQEECE